MFFDILCHLSHNSPNPANRAFPICHCRLLHGPNASKRNGLIQRAVIPESQLNGGVWDTELPFLSTLLICFNWLLCLINGWMNSSEVTWREKNIHRIVLQVGRKREGRSGVKGRKCRLHSITTLPSRHLLIFYGAGHLPCLITRSAQWWNSINPDWQGSAPLCPHREESWLHQLQGKFLWPSLNWGLLLLWLKQKGFEVFPVITHSSQKHRYSNKSHLCKHQRLSHVHTLWISFSPDPHGRLATPVSLPVGCISPRVMGFKSNWVPMWLFLNPSEAFDASHVHSHGKEIGRCTQ